jgi:UDP-3-O-[3-hydroxymyristoyl] glucosamine N-acyltransferase
MRFAQPKTLGDIAQATGSHLSDPSHAGFRVFGINTADCAEEGDLVWAESKEALASLEGSPAAAAIVPSGAQNLSIPALYHPLPKLIFGKLLEEFIPDAEGTSEPNEIHPSAKVDPRAVLAGGIKIGARSRIMAGAVLGQNCELGEDCSIGSNAVLNWGTRLGNRVIVHSNTVLGTDGFGYVQKPVDGDPTTWESLKVSHAGIVVVEDDVEIGACVCIDRGLLQPTVIGRGSKIDNLVQIGHNCQIGPHNILIGQVGFSGSITTGKNVIAAGQAGVADHSVIGDRSVLMAGVKIMGEVPPDSKLVGYPPLSRNDFWRWTSSLMDVTLVRKILKAAESAASFEEFKGVLAGLKLPSGWFKRR